jgi:hypothetical protein
MRLRKPASLYATYAGVLTFLGLAGCVEPQRTCYGAGHRWRLEPQNAVQAYFAYEAEEREKSQPLYVCFAKTSPERRFLRIQMADFEAMPEAQSLALTCYCLFIEPCCPSLTLAVADQRGDLWFHAARRSLFPLWEGTPPLITTTQPTPASQPSAFPMEAVLAMSLNAGIFEHHPFEVRFPLKAFRRAVFSEGKGETLRPEQVTKLFLGVVLDGETRGVLKIIDAKFTNDPFRPTRPFVIGAAGEDAWAVAHDPAVQGRLTVQKEGPEGRPCMKFEFTMPGGRHMYALPNTPVPGAELEGYKALRFTYKADLPKGIGGLLVCLWKSNGAQYCADPAPPPSSDWKTVTIPFESFKLGGWSRDPGGGLDLSQVVSVVIGFHGTATDSPAKGVIQVTDMSFDP